MSQHPDKTRENHAAHHHHHARGHFAARASSRVRIWLRKPMRQRTAGAALGIIGLFTLWSIAMTQLTDTQQLIFGGLCFAIFLTTNRIAGRGVSLFLVALSFTISFRYIVWRATTTLNYDSLTSALLGSGLVLAEMYALLVMTLGYLQTTWILERKPLPLPGPPGNWPTVDVYVPTYNEDLEIVRTTVLAAMSLDYPRSKLNVYILDDGKRALFREFAESCGAGYIARADNAHAKAGNLNHALRHTDGEFIAIFDCDHIPTRAFLQMSLGWLVRDKKMALVQTPHHFYTLDPFERNLATGTSVPNEGNMFYGLVQPGNDLWNAAFFCGSCAVLRRSAIEAIGGFAVETVTEDAHTALRLYRNGWNSAYLRVPLAAGLATERLSVHIGQRARWARGMIQIFRIDNPMLGPGLSFGQRICYLNAMLHFLFPIPRLVFLTAPLAYLLLGQNIIAASPLAIVAYAGPHLLHTIGTNSRLQKNWRHSFWSEVYETVLALPLVRPTTTAMLDPSRGKFNVTTKGSVIEKDYFDVGAVRLNLILAGLLAIGLLRGLYGIATTPHDHLAFQAYLLNSIWIVFSLTTVFVAIAVGRERKQPRRRPRLLTTLPAILILPDGTEVDAFTQDISRGGISVTVDQKLPVAPRTMIRVILPVGGARTSITARLLWVRPEGEGVVCGVSFNPANIAEETAIIRATFGRADAWLNWNHQKIDHPLVSLKDMLVCVIGAFRHAKTLPAAAIIPADEGLAYEAVAGTAPASDLPKDVTVLRPRRTAALGLAFSLLLPLVPQPARAQTATPSSTPPAVTVNPPMPPLLPSIELQPPSAAGQEAAAPAPPSTPSASSPPAQDGSRTLVLTLRQLGASGPFNLRGMSPLQGLLFGIRSDEVVSGAILTLNGAMSPALLPALSNVTVTLNEQYVGTIPVNASQPQYGPLTMNINPAFFLPENRLNFSFSGAYTTACNNPLSNLLWASISDNSTLTLILTKLPPSFDLSTLPAPFFDAHERLPLTLPFVLPAQPSDDELKAAGIVASWFGKLADFRGAPFTARNDAPPQGNAVVIAIGNDAAANLSLQPFKGPTLEEIANPNDPASSLLVIGGSNGDEVIAAAQTLALGSRLASGSTDTVSAPAIPARVPYDAPNWIPTDRKVQLGELVAAGALTGSGYSTTLNVPFQIPPDLYTWRQQPFNLSLLFRAPPGPVLDVAASHLDVAINGTYLASTSLAPKLSPVAWLRHAIGLDLGNTHRFTVAIPPYDVFTQNRLLMTFDGRPLDRGACKAIPDNINYAIDPASTIDFSSAYHFSAQPRLSFFQNAGFPFSIYADLSQTAVVLPAQPDNEELSAYLTLMGRFGRLTGYPAVHVTVTRPQDASSIGDKHLLVLANMAQTGDLAALLTSMPVQINGNTLSVPLPGVLDEIGQVFGDRIAADRRGAAAVLQSQLGPDDALLMGAQSPLAYHRTEILLLAKSSHGLNAMVQSLGDPAMQSQIRGDLTILAGGTVSSYRIGPEFWIGWLPPWLWPTWILRGRPELMLLLLVSACLLVAVGIYWPLRRRSARRLSRRDQK